MESTQRVVIPSKKKNFDSIEDPDCNEAIKQINEHKSTITYISLEGNSYSKEFCEKFGELLKECTALTHLNLNDIFVSRKKDEIPSALESLTKPLISLPNFVALDLSNNAVGPNGATAISGYLEKATSLRIFLINNCGLGIQGATIIGQALKRGNVNLEVIAMARNRLENDGTKEIAAALKEMTNIKEVHLFQDVIRAPGMIPLLQALMDKKLTTLDISDNFINDDAVDVFCEFLEKCETIQNLNVSDCNVQEDDNEKIVKALENSKLKLQKIGYNHNELLDSEIGKRFLQTLLEKNAEIKRVDIRGNEFKKSTKQFYTEKAGHLNCLSAFESDDDEEEGDDLAKEFSSLRI